MQDVIEYTTQKPACVWVETTSLEKTMFQTYRELIQTDKIKANRINESVISLGKYILDTKQRYNWGFESNLDEKGDIGWARTTPPDKDKHMYKKIACKSTFLFIHKDGDRILIWFHPIIGTKRGLTETETKL